MKALPYKWNGVDTYEPCEPADVTHLAFKLPSQNGSYHMLRVITRGDRDEASKKFKCPVWTWNGNVDKPTLRPSVISRSGHYDLAFKPGDPCWCEYNKTQPEDKSHFCCYICHTWITNGQANYLPDTTHEASGKVLDLLDIEF